MKLINFLIKYPLSVFLIALFCVGVGLFLTSLLPRGGSSFDDFANVFIFSIALFFFMNFIFVFICTLVVFIYKSKNISIGLKILFIVNVLLSISFMIYAYFDCHEDYQRVSVATAFCVSSIVLIPFDFIILWILSFKNKLKLNSFFLTIFAIALIFICFPMINVFSLPRGTHLYSYIVFLISFISYYIYFVMRMKRQEQLA